MTLTLDFQGQILKKSYLRNGMANWHRTKGMWVDRMFDPCCGFQHSPHPWPWPWIFKVKFWKCCISGIGWPIDMERKGCESIECSTHFVIFNFDLNHDLDFGFSKSNFEKVVSQQWDGRLTWNEKNVSRYNVGPMLWLSTFASPMNLTLDFVTFNFDLNHDLDFGFSRSNFWKSCISAMGWQIDMEQKKCESI